MAVFHQVLLFVYQQEELQVISLKSVIIGLDKSFDANSIVFVSDWVSAIDCFTGVDNIQSCSHIHTINHVFIFLCLLILVSIVL